MYVYLCKTARQANGRTDIQMGQLLKQVYSENLNSRRCGEISIPFFGILGQMQTFLICILDKCELSFPAFWGKCDLSLPVFWANANVPYLWFWQMHTFLTCKEGKLLTCTVKNFSNYMKQQHFALKWRFLVKTFFRVETAIYTRKKNENESFFFGGGGVCLIRKWTWHKRELISKFLKKHFFDIKWK